MAQERLTRTADGRVLLTLKTEWSDGTTALLFEPMEFLERLAALTTRPRINLVLHHGVLAPHSRWRTRAVAYWLDPSALPALEPSVACATSHAPTLPPGELGSGDATGPPPLDPVATSGLAVQRPGRSGPEGAK